MPSLPFTFEDLQNLNVTDSQRIADESNPDMSMHNPGNRAQSFLKGKLGKLKDSMSSTDGLIDLGLAMNPVTRALDMGDKFFGGEGVHKGFVDGTTMTGDVRVPPMVF
jgi:hypothetical protein